MSNEFGYIGTAKPTQAVKSNSGVFSVNEHKELIEDEKILSFGQLELIQTQTVSSAVCDFTALQESTYDIHFFTFTDVHIGSQTEFGYRLSNDGGSSFETTYRFGNTRLVADAGHAERVSTGQDSARLCGDIDAAAHSLANGYLYLHNAGDSATNTFSNSHMVFEDFQDIGAMEYGGQQYNTVERNNAIRFGAGTGVTALTSATISLYGIKRYS